MIGSYVKLTITKKVRMMGFIRQQEEKLAAKLILRTYTQKGLPPPDPERLQLSASLVVDEAHRIARFRGKNVLSILKDMAVDIADDLKKRSEK